MGLRGRIRKWRLKRLKRRLKQVIYEINDSDTDAEDLINLKLEEPVLKQEIRELEQCGKN